MDLDEIKSKPKSKWWVWLLVILVLIAVTFVILKKYDLLKTEKDRSETDVSQKDDSRLPDTDKTAFNVLPVKFEDFIDPPKMYGLWPYGVRGRSKEDHNEGHPGWDFELKKGSKVYAIADLQISQIHDGDIASEGSIVKVIEAYAKLADGRYHIVYHSVKNLEAGVQEGAVIKEGEPLAEAGLSLSPNSVMIHFGVFKPFDSVGSCPTPFFSTEAQTILNKILAMSIDVSTKKPFSSACLGKISKSLYESNYPERIKDFGGSEEFE